MRVLSYDMLYVISHKFFLVTMMLLFEKFRVCYRQNFLIFDIGEILDLKQAPSALRKNIQRANKRESNLGKN